MRAWVRSVARDAHTVCLPNPVLELGAPDAAPLERRPNLILFSGRLEGSKGIFDLLEAVRSTALLAARRAPGVRGATASASPWRATPERLGIADAVKFTGWVGPSGKRALLETAAVFALPSYDEALPVGLCEAMAAGVPAVVSPVGGIPEVVTDGVSGLPGRARRQGDARAPAAPAARPTARRRAPRRRGARDRAAALRAGALARRAGGALPRLRAASTPAGQ
jgi:glycosyltransferase involved in cell wall biosynthesis